MNPDEIAAGIRVRNIQTPLARLVGFPATEPAAHALQMMTDRQFDSAPVFEDGQVTGYVLGSELKAARGAIGPHVHAISIDTVVTGDTPLSSLLSWLIGSCFLYVVEGNRIAGIVTPFDLNKQAGRTYFYLFVSALELRLAECIRNHFHDQEAAVQLLPDGRRRRLRDRLRQQRQHDVVADHVAAMDFADLFSVIGHAAELRQCFGLYTGDGWRESVVKPICDLRNQVMHTVRTFVTDEPESLRQLIGLDNLVRALLAARVPNM